MTKADIVQAIYDRHGGLTKKESKKLVNFLMKSLKEKIMNEERIMITGLGSFEVVTRKSREGRNPQTGEKITIPARKKLVFRCSETLKEDLNES